MRGVNFMLSQLWVRKTTRFLCAISILLVLISHSALAANQTNELSSVTMEAGAVSPTVLIKTAEPVGYRYTVYDSFDPIRVVIDFPGMALADLEAVIPVQQGSLQEIRTASFDLSSGSLSRVEILLQETTEYQVNLDENEFRITFASDPPATQENQRSKVAAKAEAVSPVDVSADATQGANVLRKVSISSGQALLVGNGNIDKHQYFTLDKPPRLIVDVYDVRPGFEERSFAADAGMKQVRVGIYDDKVRLVFDVAGATLPAYTVTKRATDIMVAWGAAIKPEAQTTPVAAVDEPTAVSEVKTESKANNVENQVADVKPVVAVNDTVLVDLTPLAVSSGQVAVEAIDFENFDGRSVIAVTLTGPAEVSPPVEDGGLVRFEVLNTTISRALRRVIDASAFPSAVTSVTPYTVSDDGNQNVRIAIELKGPVAYALEVDDRVVRFVVDDGAYAEPIPAAVSQKELVAPVQTIDPVSAETTGFTPVTAQEMAKEAAKYNGEKITLVFDSANVRSILQLIGDVSGLNILASSDVGGNVTLRLIDVPWDQALDLVLETAGLGKIQEGNVLRILPKNKIQEMRQADMAAEQLAIDEGILESKVFPISHASVDDMKGYLTDIMSDRGSIIADSRNKQLIVRDVATVLEQMQVMIGQIDKPERQVMIEARIVEANVNFAHDMGVKWLFGYRDSTLPEPNQNWDVTGAALGMGGSFVLNPATSAGFASNVLIGALDGNLQIDLLISALESSGEANVISTPRVTTLNGQKAVISQGTKIPFATTSDAGTNVEFENAELKLEVTPEINPDGSIILDINATSSAVGSAVPVAGGLAMSIDAKEAKTKVLVRDGQTTVIGGIFIEDERDSNTGVPILKDIPFIGHLFKSTSTASSRKELLIFITPRIVEP